MGSDNLTPTREILVVCNQVLENFDANKIDWTMEELYFKLFCKPDLDEGSLSFDSFKDDMNWIIGHGLIIYDEGKLKIDELTIKLLLKYFNDHTEIAEK